MTKAEVISAMAQKSGLTQSQAKQALEAFIACVTEAARRGEDVRLVGFGNFVPVTRAAGMARNPRTGQQVPRPESRTIKFRVGEGLKGSLL
jgi:DNA-binding protein HU-beta